MSDFSLWETAFEPEYEAPEKRMVIKLAVADISATAPFYRHFLGRAPSLQTADRAEFEAEDPAVRIILTRSDAPKAAAGHYGFQMKNTRFIEEAEKRLVESGFKLTDEDDVACCYAVQTKVWAADPGGNRWEFFVTTEAEADEGCGPDCICHQDLERTYVA